MAGLPERRPLLCYITDRRGVSGEDVLAVIKRAIAAGVDLIQIREKDWPARVLAAVVEAAVGSARNSPTRILVNDRLDVALAAGAHGVHLPAKGLPVAEVRRAYPALLIGASCHNLDELHRAEEGGADFAVFGPVFQPLSKESATAPLGVEKLAEAARAVPMPVLALGGVTLENAGECLRAGAAGVAAITLFQKSTELKATTRRLRALWSDSAGAKERFRG
ncbi:MAG TPA: thiamine phosphate synthase [Candidatus Xenobia bacterium]|nr:thiamine phosphate synthase [Candidatus Xenobia bacterium]